MRLGALPAHFSFCHPLSFSCFHPGSVAHQGLAVQWLAHGRGSPCETVSFLGSRVGQSGHWPRRGPGEVAANGIWLKGHLGTTLAVGVWKKLAARRAAGRASAVLLSVSRGRPVAPRRAPAGRGKRVLTGEHPHLAGTRVLGLVRPSQQLSVALTRRPYWRTESCSCYLRT